MRRTLIVDPATRIAVDAIVAGPGYEPPEGLFAVASEEANIGWAWDGAALVPPLPPAPSVAQLAAYAAARRDRLCAAGLAVDVGTPDAPCRVAADTDADGKANLGGILQGYALGELSGDYTWFQTGGSVTLTLDQLRAVSAAVMRYVAAVYAAWQSVDAGLSATPPTVTSIADIDAAPWPSSELAP